ncbi:hypothetical protein M9H77_14025 [Catharanthus roseus]|uniref:Uncharacterized protein n=1 Tax=Catharanthus roseus TaxID=4058 RepID=A0ACC0BM43_CATRO|nr:hypothetical protein M9H77_14025 [Catharanthus roseus]
MSIQGYQDMLVHNPYPFHEVGYQGRPQARDGRRRGQGARGYHRPREEAPRQEAWRDDNLFEDFGEDPNRTLIFNEELNGWIEREEDDFQDDIFYKKEGQEDQEIDSYEAIQEGFSLVTIRALSNQVFEEERKKERLESEKKKMSIKEGKRVDERKVSVQKPREEKLSRDKKMSNQKSDSGKREKRYFYAKESEIIEAIEKEEMVLLMYCKVKIIEVYKDVFPDEVLHPIDLVPIEVFPNRLTYRSSPEETKELRRQFEDLLSKGLPYQGAHGYLSLKREGQIPFTISNIQAITRK